MKPTILLDTAIFAIPNDLVSEEIFEELFGRIVAWDACIRSQNCVNIAIDDDAISYLALANCFPAHDSIKALLDILELGHVYSARDLNRKIYSILERASPSSEVTGFKVTDCDLIDCHELSINVDNEHLLKASISSVATVLFAASQTVQLTNCIFVPGYNVDGKGTRISVSVTVAGKGAGDIGCDGPQALDCEVKMAQWPEDVLAVLDADAAWDAAEATEELALPISLKAAEKLNIIPQSLPLGQGRGFKVGEGFLASLEHHEAGPSQAFSGTTLDRCASVVAANTNSFERDFGKSRSADKAQAKRVHVTKRHQALRLMFWHLGETIEFANVGVKSELWIDEGNPRGAFEARY